MAPAWDPCDVPWLPELFSAPALQAIKARRRRDELASVSFFDGLLSGDLDALLGSFAGDPEFHHPMRGRNRGADELRRLVRDYEAWMTERNVTVEDVNVIHTPSGGVEEDVLHLDGDNGRVALPVAVAADQAEDGRMTEVRVYHSTWPLAGGHATRAPLLQPDPELRPPDVVGAYQDALAAGDADGAVGDFEPDGSAREPAGHAYVHRGTDELRALYERYFSNGGGIPL